MSREINKLKKKVYIAQCQTAHEYTETTLTSQQVWVWRLLSVTFNASGQEANPEPLTSAGGFTAHLIPTVDASADQEGAS